MKRPILCIQRGEDSQSLSVTLRSGREGTVQAELEWPWPDDHSGERPLKDRLAKAVEAAFAQEEVTRRSRIEVHLGPPVAQVRTLRELPPGRGRDLVKLVRAQQDRFFRPVDGEAVISARWTVDSEGQKVARAAAAGGTALEAIEDAVGAAGGRVGEFIAVPHRDSDATDGLKLHTRKMVRRRMITRIRDVATILILMTSGWALSGAVYVIDLVRDDRALREELREVRATLAQVDSLEARLADFAPVAEAFTLQTPGGAWAAERLADIARGLPDESHLHAARIQRDGTTGLLIHGPNPNALLDSLKGRWKGAHVQFQDSLDDEAAAGNHPVTVLVEETP